MSIDRAHAIAPERLPRHVAVIMDGNGRWARMRGMPRTQGHREGLSAAKRVVKTASEIGISFISLYTFSTENWKRAVEEVSFLMSLVRQHLRKEYDFYRENGIRVVHSGNLDGLPSDVREEVVQAMESTGHFTGLTVNLALNYGGRDEIVRAVNRWLSDAGGSKTSAGAHLTEEAFRPYLDRPDIPDPDLLIRTGGEKRISNFLLWQSAYSELHFSDKLWPDWTGDDLIDAVLEYQHRDRRFGGVS
jgi:undecaprenyl diphosphate synthase